MGNEHQWTSININEHQWASVLLMVDPLTCYTGSSHQS